jgi:hypothetical protein
VRVYCEARDCRHSAALLVAEVIYRFGDDASSNVLRTKAKCTACGAMGPTIRLPSWIDAVTGHAPFPGP